MKETPDSFDITEFFISVDVETAGPSPWRHALLSIGACTLEEPRRTFSVELQPDQEQITPEAFATHGLSLDELKQRGQTPRQALLAFEGWLQQVTPPQAAPVFVGFNAPFDWMFVAYYFERYLERNPFGHAAIDIKSYYMGQTGTTWRETSMRFLGPLYLPKGSLTHDALSDALDQGHIFRQLLDRARRLPTHPD
jgi:DNA polymerase III epsilon subunit-like protein